jgi:hypothetical protein
VDDRHVAHIDLPVATTAGIPYSRATREACAARLPPSVIAVAVGVLGTDIVLLTLGITGLAPTRSSSALATSPWGYSRTPSCSRRR